MLFDENTKVYKNNEDKSFLVDFNGFPYHVPFNEDWWECWEEVNEFCQIHHNQVFDISELPAKDTPTIEELKDKKVQEAINAYNTAIDRLAEDYPINEKLTFDQQMKQATTLSYDPNTADADVVRGIAFGRNVPVDKMVPKILKKVKEFQYPAGVYLGRKQRVQDLVNKAKSIEEVEAIDVQAIFAEPLK